MNYLVTGAAGFIGAAIAKKLLESGNTCTTVDNLFTGRKEHIPEGCKFIQGNVSDPMVIKLLCNKNFDAIVHIAGQSSGEVSFDDPVYDLHTNTQSTLLLLELARNMGCQKFIYASSMSVYGNPKFPCCSESTLALPKSFYAVGKLASENYLRIYSEFGMACTALRFFNVYGVGQNMENLRQGMASIFLAMAINNRHILIKGSKSRFRDFVYIDDVVNAVMLALENQSGYKVYNVSTNVPTTVENVVKTIQASLPYDITVKYSGSTPGDQFGIYGNNSLIRKELKWEPKISFESGMSMMIDWAIRNTK